MSKLTRVKSVQIATALKVSKFKQPDQASLCFKKSCAENNQKHVRSSMIDPAPLVPTCSHLSTIVHPGSTSHSTSDPWRDPSQTKALSEIPPTRPGVVTGVQLCLTENEGILEFQGSPGPTPGAPVSTLRVFLQNIRTRIQVQRLSLETHSQ